MKKGLILSFLSIALLTATAQITYPVTRKVDTVDNYFGVKVADPYRWLEDDNSAETKDWVQAQNKVTNDYLLKIPYRDKVRQRLEELFNYPRYSAPVKEGGYYYYFKNDLFLFASELKSFHQHPAFTKEIDVNSLSLFLQYSYIPTPYSIFKNVAKINPGHFIKLSLKDKKIDETKYCDVDNYYNILRVSIS